MTQEEEQLFQAIEILTQGSLPYDQTKRGRITEKLENNIYKVTIQGDTYKVKSKFNFNVDESVLILFPQGRKNDLYIYPNE